MADRLLVDLEWDRPVKPLNEESRHCLRIRARLEGDGSEGMYIHVAVVLDTSRSMEENGRMAQAVEACKLVARQLRPEDRLSLACYSKKTTELLRGVPGGPDTLMAVSDALSRESPRGVTRTDLALNWLADVLQASPQNTMRIAVLITDGYPTDSMGNEIEDTTGLVAKGREIGRDGITLYTVGLGDAAGFNADFLDNLSNHGRGEFIYAAESSSLVKEVASRLGTSFDIGTDELGIRIEPLLRGLEVEKACRIRPVYSPLGLHAEGEEITMRGGALQLGQDTDYLLMVKAPVALFGTPEGRRDVLNASLTAQGFTVSREVGLDMVDDPRDKLKLNADVHKDRQLWDVNGYTKELQTCTDTKQTAELLAAIESTARDAGSEDVADAAAKRLDDLKKTGALTRHNVTSLLISAKQGGSRE